MGPLPQILTDSVHSQVANALREAIVSGALQPGESLSETVLAQRFGVSRTPVRESLKQLEREGLVEIRPRVGTFVSNPTPDEVFELFTLKEALEGLAAGLMARRGDGADLAVLERTLQELEDAAGKDDHEAYADANDRFHDAVMRGSANGKLQEHFRLLINQVPYRRFVYLSLGQPHRLEDSLREHRRIVEAIRAGEYRAAEEAMRHHVAASREQLNFGLAERLGEHDGNGS